MRTRGSHAATSTKHPATWCTWISRSSAASLSGHKVHGRAKGKRDRKRGMGYWYIHNVVDDYSRLTYSELLEDERKEALPDLECVAGVRR